MSKFKLTKSQVDVLSENNISPERFISEWTSALKFEWSNRCLENMLCYIAEHRFYNVNNEGFANLYNYMKEAKRPYGNKNIELSICHCLSLGSYELRNIGFLPTFVEQECRRLHENACALVLKK